LPAARTGGAGQGHPPGPARPHSRAPGARPFCLQRIFARSAPFPPARRARKLSTAPALAPCLRPGAERACGTRFPGRCKHGALPDTLADLPPSVVRAPVPPPPPTYGPQRNLSPEPATARFLRPWACRKGLLCAFARGCPSSAAGARGRGVGTAAQFHRPGPAPPAPKERLAWQRSRRPNALAPGAGKEGNIGRPAYCAYPRPWRARKKGAAYWLPQYR
jgi:hypothetical protein